LAKRICASLDAQGCEIRGDEAVRSCFGGAKSAEETDWATEFLDLVVSMRVVENLDEAIDHINTHGSKHTDAIVTNREDRAETFVRRIDSANVFVNCSTRFSDGGEYGLGAEIGISTDKLHARGPMGAADLTTYKWVVRGDGQLRR
jgi:glutamate-5-semialdehyde dehydrogenase